MTEVPRIRVQAVDLHGECPVALYDSRRHVEVAIDFGAKPEEIVSALTDLFQESVDTGRWSRSEHSRAYDSTTEPAAPHPESGRDH
ncbi:hypothetical protein EAO77_02655 [Streptomyces sp. t39]|nr:hypothetical protein EAO77_02655 [Streptomyces sp. t39]